MIPVITIDGPSGVGKGTLSARLAAKLKWNFLDSGAIYRAFALYAQAQGVALEDEAGLVPLAESFPLVFNVTEEGLGIFLGSDDITRPVRLEETGTKASMVAKLSLVRAALLERQRDFAKPPGLIADGRDMGTVVFPQAPLKLFLTANSQVRAQRRYQQLLEQDICVKMTQILVEIEARDARDKTREAAPLKPADDALIIDTSCLTQEEVFQQAYQKVLQTEF